MIVVGEGIRRAEESPFLEAEKPTMGSLQLRRGVLRRPSNYADCGMLQRNEPRTGRHCLEDQMADSGFLESAEVGSHRLSGPAFPEGLVGLAPRFQCFYEDLGSWLKQQLV